MVSLSAIVVHIILPGFVDVRRTSSLEYSEGSGTYSKLGRTSIPGYWAMSVIVHHTVISPIWSSSLVSLIRKAFFFFGQSWLLCLYCWQLKHWPENGGGLDEWAVKVDAVVAVKGIVDVWLDEGEDDNACSVRLIRRHIELHWGLLEMLLTLYWLWRDTWYAELVSWSLFYIYQR